MSNNTSSEAVPMKLGIVIASTRPGRVGLPIGLWTYERAVAHGAFQVELFDLAEINLPFLDEPNHPRLHQYMHQHTKDWSAKVDTSDAFVFVTPEYNYSMNAPLKNAIDYLHQEWQHKPVALVSYGGVSGGLRAAQMIKQVVTTLNMMPISEAVTIPMFRQFLNDQQHFVPNETIESSAKTMFDALERWAKAMRALRSS